MKYVFEKRTTRLQTQANTIICLLGDAYEAPLANIKIEHQRWSENPLILGRTGTHGSKTDKLILWSTFR